MEEKQKQKLILPDTAPTLGVGSRTERITTLATNTTTMKQRINTGVMTPDEITALRHAERLAYLTDSLTAAIKGHEQLSPWTNGCKSRAALIRKRKAELTEATEKPYKVDLWSEMIDTVYAKQPISTAFIACFSDKRMLNEECRSMREQALDCITGHGYTPSLDGVMYIHFSETFAMATV